MAEKFSRSVLRVVIAQLSQAVGFNSIQASSLDVLTSILERYLLALGKTVHDYSENCLQTRPHLTDVEFALRQLRVSIPDMLDYIQQMEPVAFPHKVPSFPMPKPSNLQFPSGHNPEDFDRDEHIPVYMPPMVMAAQEEPEKKDENVPPAAGQQGKAANFVIAGRHSQDSSSGDDDYSAGELSNEENMSEDDSLSHNPSKSRHLTKPEDIPTVEGTAPSSMMSVPSSADIDDMRYGMSPARRFSYDAAEEQFETGPKKGRRPITDKNSNRKPSDAQGDVPWLSEGGSVQKKWSRPSEPAARKPSWSSQAGKQNDDRSWASKKAQDKYDADWLQDEPSSPVHLTKPPTPDGGTVETTTLEKRSWYDDDEKSPPTIKTSQPPKRPGDTPYAKSKFGQKAMTSTPVPSQKHTTKPFGSDHKPLHKHYKTPFKSSAKKPEKSEEPIKAKIEAAEKLIQGPPVPPYQPSSPKLLKKKHLSQPVTKSPVRSSIERAEKLLKHPLVEHAHFSSRESSPAPSKSEKMQEKLKDSKLDRSSNFASSKSMYDAIDAVIHRAVKEDELARKEAEDKELMKFSHLVKDSSSSDSEPDVSDKAEQMLQLEERGLREARPPTPGSPSFQPPTPASFAVDDEDDMTIDTDDDSSGVTPVTHLQKPIKSPLHTPKPPSKPDKHLKKEKHKKKSRKISRDDLSAKTPKIHSSLKMKVGRESPIPPGSSFVTTETISESKSVKMKVKLKPSILEHPEPKLFDVDKDRDRIRVTESKHVKHSKEEKHKTKDGKHHKSKEHKKHQSPKFDHKKSPDLDQSVEKIILKKSKSGDAKVVKPKVEHKRSPSPPPIVNRNLPLPKLSAAVPVMSVTAVSRDKEKKKSKKEKKKKKDRDRERSYDRSHEKEKHHDRSKSESGERSYEKERSKDEKSSRRESKESDSSLMVPKLTLKMGASEKKFVIKQPSSSGSKSSGKKRSHSFIADNPTPAKERKVSVESIKQDAYPAPIERKVITQTISAGPVGVTHDDQGNKVANSLSSGRTSEKLKLLVMPSYSVQIWICPGCNKPDDGSPMIGCDTCDDWYHWPCVNISEEPPDDEDWFCPRCRKRQQQNAKGKKKKKK